MGKGSGSSNHQHRAGAISPYHVRKAEYYLKGGHAVVQPPLGLSSDSSTLQVQSTHHQLIQHHSPKGLLNVGNTCYANAVLQCLLSTALPQALLDPNAGAIFRRYSSNPTLLAQGSGSVDSDDEELEFDHKGCCNDDDSSNNSRTRSKRRRPRRPCPKMMDKSKWLTRELKAITVEYHMMEDETHDSNSNSKFDLFAMLSAKTQPAHVVDPGSITKRPDRLSPCLRPYQQEDAHEFLRALLGTLVMNGQNKHLSSLFDGLLESSVTCQTCQRPSLTRDRYMDLSLDIDRPHVGTLTEALSEYTALETLNGDNQVFCSRCRCKQDASKGLRLATAPSILVCHLKRFAMNQYGRLVRVNKHVHFPERLHIGSYMSKANKGRPPPYDLVALLVHQGSTCDSGHYLAFVKHAGEWYMCNDSVVQKVDVKTVLSQQAYILMYEVAEMRANHGYPSPHSKKNMKNKRGDKKSASSSSSSSSAKNLKSSLSSGYFCGFDDSFLRDVCCYDAANIFEKVGRNNRPAPEAARDDSTLGDSTNSSRGHSPTNIGMRRSSSSGNLKGQHAQLYRSIGTSRLRSSIGSHRRNSDIPEYARIPDYAAAAKLWSSEHVRRNNNTVRHRQHMDEAELRGELPPRPNRAISPRQHSPTNKPPTPRSRSRPPLQPRTSSPVAPLEHRRATSDYTMSSSSRGLDPPSQQHHR